MPVYNDVRVERTHEAVPPSGVGPRFPAFVIHCLSGVCGIVLAIGAFTASEAADGLVSGPTKSGHQSAANSASQRLASASSDFASIVLEIRSYEPVSNHYVFYLVRSQEQKDALIASARGVDFQGPASHIAIVSSQRDEVTMGNTQAELAESGHTGEIRELRALWP